MRRERLRMAALSALLGAVPGWLAWLALAALLVSCFQAERVSGSSTEAGNATGKLSQADGSPASGVSVALVARTYVPDTAVGAAGGGGDRAGSYYRTRTDADGNYSFRDVAPGTYRLMAVGQGAGSLTDSVVVGPDTARVDQVLKPLGALQGAVKLVGSDEKVNLWVSPVATLKDPPRADSAGGFRLDSLPEGEYDLLPLCFECAPAEKPYRVRVRSGEETALPDTLKLYPGYFRGFPDSGGFEVRAADLPVKVTGKTSRLDKDALRPRGAAWTWEGRPLPAEEATGPEGILETSVQLDSALLGTADSGNLQVTLAYPDTLVSRTWRVKVDRSAEIWQARLVEADSVVPIPGPSSTPRWRVKVAATRHLEPADLAWWGLSDRVAEPRPGSLPEWISLGASEGDAARIGAREGRLTFILLPDARQGGRIFRPRRDERLEDFSSIRRFDAAKLAIRDSLEPSMLPGGLFLDRLRGPGLRQRYRVDADGAVTELVDFAALPAWGAATEPLLFWRTGRAGAGFAWNGPARDAASLLAVTREGSASFPGSAAPPVSVPPAEMAALDAMLGSLSADPPGIPDTADLDSAGSLAYLRYGRRGLLLDEASVDSALPAFHAWLLRNGLAGPVGPPAFPLAPARWEFLAFAIDTGIRRYTGDTLRLALAASGTGTRVEEELTPGSPARLAGDTLAVRYRLALEGDTLVAAADSLVSSRLFGSIGARLPLFAVAGLARITATVQDGLPVLTGGGNILAGRLEGDLVGWGNALVAPGLLVDGRGIMSGAQGRGYLFTPGTGLELAWRFGGRSGAPNTFSGWDRQ